MGSRTIRKFDARWPALHTRVHHSAGLGPLALRGQTEVVSVERPFRLLLEARLRPLGVLGVDFRLRPEGGGTSLEIVEWPKSGLVASDRVRRAVTALLAARNRVMARRRRRLVDVREEQRHMVEQTRSTEPAPPTAASQPAPPAAAPQPAPPAERAPGG